MSLQTILLKEAAKGNSKSEKYNKEKEKFTGWVKQWIGGARRLCELEDRVIETIRSGKES